MVGISDCKTLDLKQGEHYVKLIRVEIYFKRQSYCIYQNESSLSFVALQSGTVLFLDVGLRVWQYRGA